MSTRYTVQQGDHVTRLAERFGFRDYSTIWMDSNNDDLRAQRPDPNVLYPGDVLYIPDKQDRAEDRPTDQSHVFVVKRTKIKLRIKLRDFDHLPLAGCNCELTVDGVPYAVTSDDDGLIQQEIPKPAHEAGLKLTDLGLEYPVKIGDLDPVETDTGWQQRLINMGYYWGGLDDAPDDERMGYALEEFQCDHDLKTTGEADDATLAKIKEIYGS
jgi:N-acetylmuramoyl-L-alanine amidase